MFDQWERIEISLKEFHDRSDLIKASFYNLITEYKRWREITEEYSEKYLIRNGSCRPAITLDKNGMMER